MERKREMDEKLKRRGWRPTDWGLVGRKLPYQSQVAQMGVAVRVREID
jgi:hypothetical protein